MKKSIKNSIRITAALVAACIVCSVSGCSTGSDPLKQLYGTSNPFKMPANYSYEVASSASPDAAPVTTGKFYVKDKKTKFITLEGSTTILEVYADMEKGEEYGITPSAPTAQKHKKDTSISKDVDADVDLLEITKRITNGKLEGFTNIGSESIEGSQCTIYEHPATNNAFKIWIDNKYCMPLKIQSIDPDGKPGTCTYIKNFKEGTVTDDMVTLPSSIKIQE